MRPKWMGKPSLIFAIDPGPEMSGYCIVSGDDLTPYEFGKVENEKLFRELRIASNSEQIVIEKIKSYGMPVGDDVFETCIWIGRFVEARRHADEEPRVDFVSRKEEKIAICGSMKANDATIRRALIDRFARFDKKTGKGTKKNPDFFYGFKADVWQAFAIAVTWKEKWEQGQEG